MSRLVHRRRDFVPQSLLLPQSLGWAVLCAAAFALFLNATAQAGSVSAMLQVRARIVSTCRVSANSLQSAGNTTQGRFNCPTNGASATSSNGAAYGESANYTVTDVPGTDGAVKILTLTF